MLKPESFLNSIFDERWLLFVLGDDSKKLQIYSNKQRWAANFGLKLKNRKSANNSWFHSAIENPQIF